MADDKYNILKNCQGKIFLKKVEIAHEICEKFKNRWTDFEEKRGWHSLHWAKRFKLKFFFTNVGEKSMWNAKIFAFSHYFLPIDLVIQ